MPTMLSIIGVMPLLIAWVGLLLLVRQLAMAGIISGRWSIQWALAAIAWGVLLAIMTEVAGAFGQLNGPTLLIGWLGIDAIVILLLLRRWPMVAAAWAEDRTAFRVMRANCPRDVVVLLGLAGTLISALFGIALFTPTTNWDSLTYHLPRMLHWLQQGTVEHFQTNNFRQVEFAPWASYAMLHLFVLGGGDQLLNLMQWSAMLSTVIVATSIVASMGRWVGVTVDLCSVEEGARSWRIVALTSLIVATIPIGVIESITTQNDYVVSFWVCCAIALGLALVREPGNGSYALAVGAAVGLATSTKSTAFVYLAPFALVFGIWWLRYVAGVAAKSRVACSVGLAFVVLTLPHMLRNQVATGSPLGSPQIFKLERNDAISTRSTCSNLIRNIALNSNSGFSPVTRLLNSGLEWLHGLTGADLNDSATTYRGCKFFFRERFLACDSYTSNTWHVLLFALSVMAALVHSRMNVKLLLYAALVVAGFVLFCGYLKWQWWHTRLHLCFLVLLAPLPGLLVARIVGRFGVVTMAVLLTAFAAFSIARNQSRPIWSREFTSLPREQGYLFVDGPHLAAPLGFVADAIVAGESRHVGLNLPFDAAEYPLWRMLANRGFKGRIDHATGKTSEYDVVVCSSESPWQMDQSAYRYSRTFGYYKLLWKEPPGFMMETSQASPH